MIEYRLNEEYIELIRLLKYLRFSETGGQAKRMVEEGRIKRNGETEYRKRAKLRRGDTIETEGKTILIV